MDFSKKQGRDSVSPEFKEIRLTNIIDQLMSNRTKDVGLISGLMPDSQKSSDDRGLNQSPRFEMEELRSTVGSTPAGERQRQCSGSPRGRDGLLTGSGSSPEGGASSSLVQGQQPPTATSARAPPPRTPHLHRHQQPSSQQPSPLPTSSPRAMPTDALASATSSAETSGNPAAGSGGSSGGLLLPKSSSSAAASAAERGTPEAESSSPSVSPHSPSPARGFPSLLAPGFGLPGLGALVRTSSAGTTAPFSPPPPSLERFSPANLAGGGAPAIKQMEMMTRNYSDFMRSLAAKYNNQNAQESFSMSQTNGLVRGFDSTFPYKGGSPFLVRGLDVEGNGGCLGGGLGRKLDNQNSPTTPHDSRVTNNNSTSIVGAAALGTCGGVADFSSSQTLLNLVRTASAQSASQLENYLKGAVKRTADGDSRIDPLDLSLSHSKRPKLEARDFRDLLQAEVEAAATASGGDCPANSRTSLAKPAWMTLLDRRLHSSPTPSSRTSPKNAMLDRQQHQRCMSMCTDKSCTAQSDASDVTHWTIEDVVKFVSSVDSCSEYAEKFRDQSIDGATLPLLTEDHLTSYLGLKLGPALKLRSTLARRIGHCAVCMHCIHCHGCATEDTSTSGDMVSRRHESSSRSPSTISK